MEEIFNLAREDLQRFSEHTPLTMIAPSKERSSFSGIAIRNFVTTTLTDGQEAVGENARVSFHVKNLLAGNPTYPVYNERNEIALKNHRVIFTDSEGVTREYAVKIVYPDYTTGMVAFDCGIYEEIQNQ